VHGWLVDKATYKIRSAHKLCCRAHIAGEIVSFLTMIGGGENCDAERYLQVRKIIS
jgi:hypothetical protein